MPLIVILDIPSRLAAYPENRLLHTWRLWFTLTPGSRSLRNDSYACKQAVADGDIRIVPERFEKVYNHWLENIRDWCISRQLWWGHRIPVWYVFSDEAAAAASDGVSDHYVVARSESEALSTAKARCGSGTW